MAFDADGAVPRDHGRHGNSAVAEEVNPAVRRQPFSFMAWRRPALALSVLTTVLSLASFAMQGLDLGLDFTGGQIVEIGFSESADPESVRSALEKAGIEGAQVQSIRDEADVIVRLSPERIAAAGLPAEDAVLFALQSVDPRVVMIRSDTIGPQVGEDLTEQGGLALLFSMIGIFLYVMLRFRWKFALGAIVATMHDAIVTVGLFSLFGWSFDLSVLGAVLAVIGYSVNDTIVVYDRIRDNFRLMRRASAEEIVDASVNQTLARTIVTGLTTLLVVVALFLFGGEALWGFSMTLILGIVIGTYSSIYVASSMAILLQVTAQDFAAERAGPIDELP